MSSCGPLDWGCDAGGWISDWITSAVGQSITALAEAITDGVSEALASLGTFWVNIPTPNLATSDNAPDPTNLAVDESFETILGWVFWFGLTMCVLSLVALGASLAWANRTGDGRRHLGKLSIVLGATILISASASIVTALLQSQGGQGSAPVAFIQSSLSGYAGGLAMLSVVVGATAMVWQQRAEPGREILRSLITLVVVSGAGLAGVQLAVVAADALAASILDTATDGTDFGSNLLGLIVLTNGVTGGLGQIIVIIVGGAALIASLAQIGLMVVRGGMLVLLAGVLPLSASFTNTDIGRNWFRKCITWTIAFILYKPAAAIIYATAFQLVGADVFQDDANGLVQVLAGVAMMSMALFALPALMRFLTPMVSGVASGAGMAATMQQAASAVPTGARNSGNGSPRPTPQRTGSTSDDPNGATSTGGPAPTTASPPVADSAAAASESGAATSATAAGSSGAAAAGPVGIAIAGAAILAEGAKSVGDAIKQAGEEAAESPSGSE
ncbi:hypothetical protein [Glaciibacter superstes]|uniref:hypothetical protein n=1 Tax=Glaciibacter superstes TaxID=501023 RepID=UPI0003B35E2B|nr:hypothetical protein [Glaciibacter superstes]